MKKLSLKDIPTDAILRQQQKWWEQNAIASKRWREAGYPFEGYEHEELPFTYEAFPEWPEKLVYKKMEKLADEGYLEYGVSLRSAWLTDKAREYLNSTPHK